MPNNKINVTLTAEAKAEIIAAVDALDLAIPFRVSLTPTERRRMLKLGPKSEGFVRDALEAARNNAALLPSTISMADLDRDADIRDTLHTLVQRVGTLYQQLVDTQMLAGSDLMDGASRIYRALRANGVGEGIDGTLAVLKQRFDRPSVTEPAPEPAPES